MVSPHNLKSFIILNNTFFRISRIGNIAKTLFLTCSRIGALIGMGVPNGIGALIRKGALSGRRGLNRIITVLESIVNLRIRMGEEDGKPCVTSVKIILFEKNLTQTSTSFKQIFL